MRTQNRILCLLLALVLTAGTLFMTASAAEVEAYWPNFRGNDVNSGITNVKLPASAQTTELKWAKKLGSGWANNPSVQIIVDNALVVMHSTNISKLDLKTGEILKTGTLSAAPSYGYTPPIYAEGLIFCPLGGGTVEAVDAKTLESKWIFKDELGGQALSPIAYSDGCVYTGFWNGEAKDANYVCLNAANGKLVWKQTVQGGFYWAGAVVVGDSLIVGTDDGASGSKGDSKLYSLNKKNGDVIETVPLTACGDQRSTITYSAEKGRVYFTTKGGYLCSVAVDAQGKLSDFRSEKQASQSTSTPVVYGDKVFLCAGSGVVSGSGGAGNFVVADADTLKQLYAVPLKAYPQASVLVSTAYLEETGKLYCYTTYNGQPGGLSLIKVDPTKNTADGAELVELYDAKGYEQYCICSPICGPDGTIYYKNDSGYVLAVGTNNAYLTGLRADVGSQKGDLAKEMEWVVPAGTKSVTFTPEAPAGFTVTVNDAAPSKAVTLTDGAGTAVIKVTVGTDTRTYTVSIREVSNNTALAALKGNESNGYSSFKELTPAFATDVVCYLWDNVSSGRTFANIWPEAADANAAIKVYAVENVKSGKFDAVTGEIEVTANSSGHDRYAIYFADDTKPVAIRIQVTAEDGTVNNTYVVISKSSAAAAAAQMKAELEAQAQQAAADTVKAKIAAIGEVSLSSEAAVTAARTAYDGLTAAQKALVDNYDVLTAAETKLAELKAEAAADQAAADAVEAKIAAIGKVSLSSEAAVKAARSAYDGLAAAQKALVENYEVLTAAETKLAALKAEAAEDQAAADAVKAKIAAIGEVSLSSEAAVQDARTAYDGLTAVQKALVDNYDVLTAAEAKLEQLQNAGTIRVNVTISNAGQVVMAQKPVTVTDRNGDGKFDMDEVLYAAHEAGFEGGAAAGYASAETQYGLSLTKLWGDTSGSFGYWCDNVSCLSLDHEVQAGANVVAFVYQDATGWSDAYTKFDAAAYTAAAGAGVRVKLEKAAYDASGNVEFSDLTGAVITAYDSDFKALNASEYTVTEGKGGEYTVTFTKAGSYYLVASGNGVITVPAVSRLTVEPGQNVPDAGDPIFWIAALPVLAMAAVVVLFRKRSQI